MAVDLAAAETLESQFAAPEGQDESLRRMSRARNYNAWLFARARRYLGPRALDVGAGIGTFTAELAGFADEVVALEPDPTDAARLRERFAADPHVTVIERSAGELGRDVPPVDVAVCFNVLEHIPDHVEALREIRARLRPDGHLLLIVPAHTALFGKIDATVGHVRRYDRRTLRDALSQAGFEIRELRHVNPVGALGWFVSSRLLRRDHIPEGPLMLFDRLVSVLSALDALRLPFGLSLWAAARPAR